MKKLEELKLEERKEIVKLFSNWLRRYNSEVVVKVMEKREEILNNDFAMNMLKELAEREEKEYKVFQHNIGHLFYDYDDFKEYDVHNHVLEHAGSYRDVLYDMFIRKI